MPTASRSCCSIRIARAGIICRSAAACVRSPVIELNRAVAVGMADGPAAGLAIIERIADEPALKNYHLLAGVRGDLLQKLGRHDEARAAFEAAAQLAGNRRDRNLMERRAKDVCKAE